MSTDRLVFRVHAVQRMFARSISVQDVRHVLATGETVENYPDDHPYPSRLILGWCGSRPLHVVAAHNAAAQETMVITAYEPNVDLWEPDFRRRR